ncbi:hypothetical protein SGM_4972 [Streptomyces griseoaurantiacus M045]|uniref:Uncharacterized protein n=1 Tax=Streptomyces griseoaurantiacus M045 TaxID=996637 RepID=F3NPA8_9ACTN|nr:hypothetical protein SGM_4972 [Streptomyces griseoaurantiacus M045]
MRSVHGGGKAGCHRCLSQVRYDGGRALGRRAQPMRCPSAPGARRTPGSPPCLSPCCG